MLKKRSSGGGRQGEDREGYVDEEEKSVEKERRKEKSWWTLLFNKGNKTENNRNIKHPYPNYCVDIDTDNYYLDVESDEKRRRLRQVTEDEEKRLKLELEFGGREFGRLNTFQEDKLMNYGSRFRFHISGDKRERSEADEWDNFAIIDEDELLEDF